MISCWLTLKPSSEGKGLHAITRVAMRANGWFVCQAETFNVRSSMLDVSFPFHPTLTMTSWNVQTWRENYNLLDSTSFSEEKLPQSRPESLTIQMRNWGVMIRTLGLCKYGKSMQVMSSFASPNHVWYELICHKFAPERNGQLSCPKQILLFFMCDVIFCAWQTLARARERAMKNYFPWSFQTSCHGPLDRL